MRLVLSIVRSRPFNHSCYKIMVATVLLGKRNADAMARRSRLCRVAGEATWHAPGSSAYTLSPDGALTDPTGLFKRAFSAPVQYESSQLDELSA